MTPADRERAHAAALPPESVVSVLLEQHARIRDLFTVTIGATGEQRRRSFDELRNLLAVHEAGEETVVRPVTRYAAQGTLAAARDGEERQAASVLAALEKLDPGTDEFARALAMFEHDVAEHAEHEEATEFPFLLGMVDYDEQMEMGVCLLELQRTAPTRPDPVTAAGTTTHAQVVESAPFAVLLDNARGAFAAIRDDA